MSTALITRVLWTALGVFIAVRSRALGLGSFEEPGPGLLAFGLGIAMAAAAAADGIRLILRRKAGAGKTGVVGADASAPQAPMKLPIRQLAVVAVLLAYIALLEPAGFALGTFAFLLALLALLSPLSWPRAIAFAVLGSALNYAVFKYGLGVQLPVGLLG